MNKRARILNTYCADLFLINGFGYLIMLQNILFDKPKTVLQGTKSIVHIKGSLLSH